MRLIKMLGLAMVASIAAMAFIGASSASAVDLLGFCKEKAALCPEGKRLEGVTKVLAHSNLSELKNNAFFSTPEKCKADNTIEVTDMKNPMPGKITSATSTECSGPCKKAEAKGLPWNIEVAMTEEMTDMYTFAMGEGKTFYSECTFGTKCEYGVPATESVSLLAEGNLIKAEEEKLEYKSGSGEGVCGSIGTWTATLEIKKCHLAGGLEHAPCYLTLLPEEVPSESDLLGFCKEKAALCPEGKRLEGVTKVLAHSNLSELKNNSLFSTPEKCASDLAIEVTDMKNPMPGKIASLTYAECSGPCKAVEAKGLPWNIEVAMTEEMTDMYTFAMGEGKTFYSECTFGTKCEYGVPATESVSLLAEGNLIKAEEEKLEYKSGSGSGVCGSTGTWTATLEIKKCHLAGGLEHAPCYLTLLPQA